MRSRRAAAFVRFGGRASAKLCAARGRQVEPLGFGRSRTAPGAANRVVFNASRTTFGDRGDGDAAPSCPVAPSLRAPKDRRRPARRIASSSTPRGRRAGLAGDGGHRLILRTSIPKPRRMRTATAARAMFPHGLNAMKARRPGTRSQGRRERGMRRGQKAGRPVARVGLRRQPYRIPLNPISLITDPTSLCPILMISDSAPTDLISLISDPATLDPI